MIRPAILWNDGRTAAECAEIEERVGLDELIARTGNRALTGFTAPKLLWLRRHEPDALRADRADRCCPRTTSACGCAASTRSTSPTRPARCCSTSRGALERRGARGAGARPRVAAARCSSRPRSRARRADGVPVAAGAGDQAAGALGVGVDRPGPLSIALGTSGVVFAALPAFAADARARVHAFCHAVPGGWHAMGVMLSAAGSLRWLRDVAAPGVGLRRRWWTRPSAWAPGVEGLTFLPVPRRRAHAARRPDARGSFTGLSLRHDRGALVRAVLEGVAYGLRDSLDLLRELGVAPERGRVSGGGARSELWLRIIASVLELPLERPVVEEGAAYGAALLGGVAGGVWPDAAAAVAACVAVRGEVEPEPPGSTRTPRGASASARSTPRSARWAERSRCRQRGQLRGEAPLVAPDPLAGSACRAGVAAPAGGRERAMLAGQRVERGGERHRTTGGDRAQCRGGVRVAAREAQRRGAPARGVPAAARARRPRAAGG